MTFITHGFRVSVVSDVRERVRDFMITFAFYVKKIFISFFIIFSAKKFREKYSERIWVFHCRYSIRKKKQGHRSCTSV